MSTFTPAPWLAEQKGRDSDWIVADADGTPVATLWYVSSSETPANARLIAEAPDLLRLLKEYRAADTCSCDGEACRYCIAGEVIDLAESKP